MTEVILMAHVLFGMLCIIAKAARKLMLWVVGLVVLIGVAMDGSGAIISIGTKVGLMKG